MSGVGCSGDLGNILLMPTVGAVETMETAYRSGYSDEAASPGYYRVTLTKGGIGAEMSATTRATIAQFTFPERDGDANILVDVSHGLTPSRDGLVRIVSPTEVEGYNDTGGFCGSDLAYRVYFVARFSKPAVAIGTWQGTQPARRPPAPARMSEPTFASTPPRANGSKSGSGSPMSASRERGPI